MIEIHIYRDGVQLEQFSSDDYDTVRILQADIISAVSGYIEDSDNGIVDSNE